VLSLWFITQHRRSRHGLVLRRCILAELQDAEQMFVLVGPFREGRLVSFIVNPPIMTGLNDMTRKPHISSRVVELSSLTLNDVYMACLATQLDNRRGWVSLYHFHLARVSGIWEYEQ
jgi:hypothetical protein